MGCGVGQGGGKAKRRPEQLSRVEAVVIGMEKSG